LVQEQLNVLDGMELGTFNRWICYGSENTGRKCMGSVYRVLPCGCLLCKLSVDVGDVDGQHWRLHEKDNSERPRTKSSLFSHLTSKKLDTNVTQVFLGYCVGNLIGQHLFFDDEAPSYPSGFLAMLICFGVSLILICLGLRYYLIWENRRRDCLGHVGNGDAIEDLDPTLLDKTDK
jgi:hypothetical protein